MSRSTLSSHPIDQAVTGLTDALMTGVARSGVLADASDEIVAIATDIMREELKDLLTGDKYANERDCILRGSVHEGYVLASVAAECILRIKKVKGEQASQPEPFRSRGHLGFYSYGNTQYEVYEDDEGDIWRAPISNVIDCRTGNRIGRWEGPARMKERIVAALLG